MKWSVAGPMYQQSTPYRKQVLCVVIFSWTTMYIQLKSKSPCGWSWSNSCGFNCEAHRRFSFRSVFARSQYQICSIKSRLVLHNPTMKWFWMSIWRVWRYFGSKYWVGLSHNKILWRWGTTSDFPIPCYQDYVSGVWITIPSSYKVFSGMLLGALIHCGCALAPQICHWSPHYVLWGCNSQ